MPDVYAHYRFGRQVLSQFSPRQRQVIGRFRRLYDMGLYGADIFSFYNPFWQTDTGALPETYALFLPESFLERAQEGTLTEGEQAYLCGLCAHYALETACGDYRQKLEKSGLSPAAVWAEFDRYLLELDGLSPHYDRSAHMTLTRGECVTAAQFFPPATAVQTHGAIRCMEKFYHFLSTTQGNPKKFPLSLLKNTPLADRILTGTPTQEAIHRASTLLVRYTRSVKDFPQFLESQLAGNNAQP